MSNAKDALVKLWVLLLLYDHAAALIVPEELPTILSLIYSNISPIKKGTDSRLGVGFRLGEHADFQVLVELGPQTETDPIGNADTKRRRDAMLGAAMRGELGPLARAIAKYQMELKFQRELERSKKTGEKLNAVTDESNDRKKTTASEWLANWSKGMAKEPSSVAAPDENGFSPTARNKTVQRIGRPPPASTGGKTTVSDLLDLYEQPAADKKTE
ncbi:snustorr snarlik [Ptiloglossa arizonensis]|uniref:snustorr snarlik n=1 Tax=Ptiloglossa arizonensis TaxID=3350558 RepID=UPI003FA0DC5A